MTPAQFQALRNANRRKMAAAIARPVDNSRELDAGVMATIAAVAADPSSLTYDQLVAAFVVADDCAAYSLMSQVVIV